jgi:outer membrane protein
MKKKRTEFFPFLIVSALLFAVGCETIDRAQYAKREIRKVSNATGSVSDKRADFTNAGLADFVSFALTNRPEIVAANLSVTNAMLSLKVISGDRALHISGGADWSRSTLNRTSHFSMRSKEDPFSSSISLDLLLYDFGRIDAREAAARWELVSAQSSLAETKLDVFGEVCTSYFQLLQNDALLEVALTNEFQYAEHLRQAKELFDAGEAVKLDVLKAKYDLSGAHLATINASNAVSVAASAFLKSLGLQNDGYSREDVVPAVKGAFDMNLSNALFKVSREKVSELLPIARITSPSIVALRTRLNAASARVDYAVSDLFPELTLSASSTFTDPVWNFSWGLRAVQSIFQGYKKTTAVDQAVVDMRIAAEAVKAAEQDLSHKLAAAVSLRDDANESYRTAVVQVEQAIENFDNVNESYKVGTASRVDFTDAAADFASALGTKVKAYYAGQMAEVEVIKLLGSLPQKETGTILEDLNNEMD